MQDYRSNLWKLYLAAILGGFAYFYNGGVVLRLCQLKQQPAHTHEPAVLLKIIEQLPCR
jgi:hypothetical protein